MAAIIEPISIPCVPVKQPIGEFYIASISAQNLIDISTTDIRQLDQETDDFYGIQRQLNAKRVREISHYVESPDASFPTSIILAISANCVELNRYGTEMKLSPFDHPEDPNLSIPQSAIARIIDGQHRIEGLKESQVRDFDLIVSIFVDISMATQAILFSTVNLAQTKVNKSLVYDLFGITETRSPQKSCHTIAIALDRDPGGPLEGRIKRLGVATEGRFDETITQATFVESLMRLISREPLSDRNKFYKGLQPSIAGPEALLKTPFRNMFLEGKDKEIAKVVKNFFDAVRHKWPTSWNGRERGNPLPQTNGFRALMRLMADIYLDISTPGEVTNSDAFFEVLVRINMQEEDFSYREFQRGAGGEMKLYKTLKSQLGLENA